MYIGASIVAIISARCSAPDPFPVFRQYIAGLLVAAVVVVPTRSPLDMCPLVVASLVILVLGFFYRNSWWYMVHHTLRTYAILVWPLSPVSQVR